MNHLFYPVFFLLRQADCDRCFKWNGSLPGINAVGNGINMCYGRHTGYGGYGDWPRGARSILLNQSDLTNGVRTWVRLDDGSVYDQITLNSSYGRDNYSATAENFAGRVAHNGGFLYFFLWLLCQVVLPYH